MASNFNEQVNELAQTIGEILASSASVKGDEFVRAVATQFEAWQLASAIAALAELADEERYEHAAHVAHVCMNILGSIALRSCDHLSDDDMEESMRVADQLRQRRLRVSEEINRGLNND